MEKIKAITMLKKYKDELPFDYDILYNKIINGDTDAYIYISWLIKHDNFINERNSLKPRTRTYYLHQPIDHGLVDDRINFIKLTENCSYFDGYY